MRLLEHKGEPVPSHPSPAAPVPWTLSATVRGTVDDGRAAVQVDANVTVLERRWVVIPLLPPGLAVSSSGTSAGSALLVRTAEGVAIAAKGPVQFTVRLAAEGLLDPTPGGARLRFAPPGLSGGRAELTVRGADQVGGATAWVVERRRDELVVSSALGVAGMELVLPVSKPRGETGTAVEDLHAVTVLALGGTGVTRVTLRASSEDGVIMLKLPAHATLWKAWSSGAPLKVSSVVRGDEVHIPVKGDSPVEFAYTFSADPMGMRGRYRVELPVLPVPVRGACWQVFLPTGLNYKEVQSSLPAGACRAPEFRTRAHLVPDGQEQSFATSVLERGAAYVEGAYSQPL